MEEKILSIIIPCYNSEKYIRECLDSLRAQSLGGVEVIVVDGGSADQTLAAVSEYSDLVSSVISEPDEGQSDAINKGFKRASGQFVTWLNSDDVLLHNSLSSVVDALNESEADCVFGNVIWFDEGRRIMKVAYGPKDDKRLLKSGSLLPFGPSAFLRQSMLEEVGMLDLSYHYIMDIDLWWRIARGKYQISRLKFPVWGLRLHQDSKTSPVVLNGVAPDAMVQERKRLAEAHSLPALSRKRRIKQLLHRFFDGSLLQTLAETARYKGKDIGCYVCKD
jgi:glycosyltransferase involved in cell wall biosynthesis